MFIFPFRVIGTLRGRRPLQLAVRMIAITMVALIACTDATGPGTTDVVSGGRYSAVVAASSRIVYLGAAKSEPINYIRAIVYDKAKNLVLGRIDQALDATKSEFELSFKISLPNPGFTDTRLTVELANHVGTTEVVQYSGRALDVKLQPSDRRQVDIDIYPGPLENLEITGVRINKPLPDRLERDSVRATAVVEGVVPNARIVWSVLDSTIAKIGATSGMITGVLPGTARVVAAVGTHADTATVKILQRRDHVTVTPGTATVPQIGESVQFVGKVVDARGAEMVGETVGWSITNDAIGNLSAAGKFVAKAPGTTKIWATSNSDATLKGNGDVTVTYVPPTPSNSLVSASPDTIVANGTATSQVTVQLRDAAGNNVTAGGKAVTAALSGTGTLTTLTDNGSGRYTATVTAPTLVGTAKVAGAFDGTAIPTQATVVYVAGAGDHYVLTTASTTTAAGTTITITAQLVDAFGNAVRTAGRTVTWGSAAGGTFSAPSSVTDANGTATISFTTGPVAGSSYTVTATDGASPAVKGTIGPITTTPSGVSLSVSTVTASPASIIANGTSTSTITVTLKDALGNSISSSGGTVTLSNAGTGSLSGVTDNGNGTYRATLTSPTLVGSALISAALGGSALTAKATVNFVAGPAVRFVITSTTTTVIAGMTITITAKLIDANGNAVPESGHVVTWGKTGDGGSFAPATSTTNASGEATVSFTTSTTSGTVHTVTVTDPALPGVTATSAPITTSAGTVSLSASAVTATPTTLDANGTSTSAIAVQLKDAGGNNLTVSGGTMTMTKVGNGTLSSVTDNANGTYTATLTSSTELGTAVITALLGTSPLTQTATVTFVVGAASLSQSTVTASPASILANGTSTSTITVRLKDAGGNSLTSSAGTVTLSKVGGGSLGAVTDNRDGTYSATLTSPVSSGNAVVTASLSGSNLTNTATITYTVAGASLANSTIAGSPTSILADDATISTLTIQLKEASGSNMTASGGTVTLAKTGVGTLSAVTDNSNGTYTATIKSGTTGTAVITAKLDGSDLTHSSNPLTVTFTPGTVSLSTSTITPTPASVAAGSTSTVRVQLKDALGNNLTSSAGTVTMATDLGSLGSVTNNNNGTYDAVLTTSTIGTATVTAKLGGSDLTNSATVTVTTGGASATTTTLSVNASSLQPSQTATITVVVKDASGNVISGATPSSIVLATSIGTIGTVSCTSGTCTATYTAGTIGTASITAKISGTNVVGSAASLDVVAGALDHFAVTATDGSALSAQRTAATSFNIKITAQDAGNNTVTSFTGTAALTTNSLFSSGTTTTTSSFTSGVLASHTVTLIRAATLRNITATKSSSTEAGTSANFTVAAGALTKLQIVVPGETAAPGTTSGKTGSPSSQTAGTAFNVTINGVDANWNTVSSATDNIGITSTDGTATLPANNVLSSGSQVFAVTLRTTGTKTVTGTDITNSSITAAVSPNITVVAGALDHFDLTLSDGTSLSSASLSANTQFDVKIVARDADNNTVTGYTGTVAITASGATFTTGGGTTASFVSGVLSSHGIVISNGGSYTLTATGSGKTGTASITLAANLADATTSTLAVGSNSLTSGQTTTVTVTLKQADGSAYTAGASSHFNLTSSLGTIGTVSCTNGVCTATYTATTAGSAVVAAKIGGTNIVNSTQTIAVTAGAPSATTSTFAVGANALTQNATTTATVVVKDAASNTISTAASSDFALAATLGTFGSVNCTSGTCTSTYTATTLGSASLTAKIGGTNIVNSPQTVVVAAVPGAVTSLTATPGNTQVTLSWSAPSSDGGSAVTDYLVEYRLSGAGSFTTFSHTASTTTNIIVTGLTNGSLYNFQVSAINAIGTGSASAVNGTPRTVPGAPTSVSGTAGSTSMDLTWTAPASDGGSAITDYVIEYSATGANSWTAFSHTASNATSRTVTGLTGGTTYDFRISATNAAGTGTPSSTFTGTPGSPSSPLSLAVSLNQVTNNSHTATLTWTVPTFTGSGITDYVIEYKTSAAASYTVFPHTASTSTTIAITGLANGTTYNFRVKGKTSATTGSYSNVVTKTTTKPSDRLSCYTPGSSNSSSASISITPCTGVALGDLIIIPVGVGTNNDASAKTVTAESGFLSAGTTNNGTYNTTVYYKYATSADVGRTAAYAFSWTGNVKSIVTLVAYKTVTGTPAYGVATGASVTIASPTVADPGVASYTLVYIFTANVSMGSTTPNLGQWTVSSELYRNTTAGANNANAVAVVTGDIDILSSGANASRTATTSNMTASSPWTAIVLTIKP